MIKIYKLILLNPWIYKNIQEYYFKTVIAGIHRINSKSCSILKLSNDQLINLNAPIVYLTDGATIVYDFTPISYLFL